MTHQRFSLIILWLTTGQMPYVSCKTGDKLPDNAVEGGNDDGPYYYAKGKVDGLTIPGKVGVKSNRNLDSACIPYGTEEHRIDSFEVLTVDDPSTLSYVRCVRTRFLASRLFR